MKLHKPSDKNLLFYKKLLLALFTIILIIAVKFDLFERGLTGITKKIYQTNEIYLKTSTSESRDLLLVLCSLQGALEVLESSSVGINLVIDTNITLGNTITPLKDMTVIARNASVVAISVLIITQLILTFFQKFSPIILIVILLLWVLQKIILFYFPQYQKQRDAIKNFTQKLSLLFIFTYFIFPITIQFNAKITHYISKPMKQEIHNNFREISENISSGNTKNSLKDYAKHEIHHFEKIIIKLHHKVDKMMINATKHFAIMIFDCFILPIFIAAILYFYTHIIFYPTRK